MSDHDGPPWVDDEPTLSPERAQRTRQVTDTTADLRVEDLGEAAEALPFRGRRAPVPPPRDDFVRPPNPIADAQRARTLPTSSAASSPPPARPAPSMSEPSRSHLELLWMQDDPAALDRARRGDRKSAQGLLPRKGRKGFVPLDDVGAWLADAEIASDRELDEIALFQRAADPPARVVQGRLSYDLCPYAELGAVRAALTRLANHHALVSEMMADTRGLAEDPLTPRSALRAAVDDLVASAARAGLRDRDLRRTTRDMLLQRRKHEQLDLLGGDHLIARLRIDADDAWVTYVPVAALSHLPLLEPLPVRAAVTIHPRQVPHEPRARALKALAIARVHDVQRSVERI